MILGLSQRVVEVEHIGEIRDCLDQSWSALLGGYGHIGVPIPNDPQNNVTFIEKIGVQGIILTGGNDIASLDNPVNASVTRDQSEKQLLDYAVKNRLPVLGVCRGFQLLNIFFGGSLSKDPGHVGVPHDVSIINNKLSKATSLTVNSFHNYVIKREQLATQLIPLAMASDGTVEAAYNPDLNWIGIMWHPERSHSIVDGKVFSILFGN